jgi:hypothetical protein
MVGASLSHPSVLMHGFFNEGPSSDPRACPAYASSAAAIRRRVPPAHRLVTWATSAKEKVGTPGHFASSTASVHKSQAAHAPSTLYSRIAKTWLESFVVVCGDRGGEANCCLSPSTSPGPGFLHSLRTRRCGSPPSSATGSRPA